MKFKHLLLLLASAAFVAVACEKNDEKKPEEKDTTPVPEISVITTAFPSIADAGGTLEVTISSNVEWSVSIPETASWLSVSPASGAAGEEITITFTATANDNYDKRSAAVTVGGENKKGSDSAEFTITQKQKGALILTDDVVEVGYEGGKVSVTLSANSDVTYAIADDAKDWIVVAEPNGAPTRALVESTYDFNVLPNPVKEAREGVITFTNEAGSETVTVKQEALPEPDPELAISPAAISDVAIDGATVKLSLTSNMPWVVSIPDGVNWLTVSPDQGEAGENIEVTVTIQGHDANDGRTTDLTFTCTNAENESKVVTVKVAQDGLNIPHDIHIANAADLVQFATDYNAGTYARVLDILTVTFDSDITFDAVSSAAFNATGGIGNKTDGANNYFLGTFDGGSHTISGLKATVPLFAYTDTLSVIKDLSVDNTCSLTVDSPAAEVNHGVLVGRSKGIIQRCHSNANVIINNIQDVNTAAQHYGALVGRNYGGTIEDCVVSGNITCAQAGQTIEANAAYIAGIAGSQANNGSIKNCNYLGNITVSDGTQFGGISASKLYFYVGGIVGYADNGLISNCNTGSSEKVNTMDVRGTLVAALGGIVGWVKTTDNTSISGCNNYMSLAYASSGARADTSPTRIGGIASRSVADISNCQNFAPITSVSNSTTIYLAGIVADGANVSNCTNNAGGSITRTSQTSLAQSNRYIYIGGIMGDTVDVDEITETISITGCINNAVVLSKTTGTASGTTIDMGGIIGRADKPVAISECDNNGQVTNTNVNTTVIARMAIGGILGYGSVANTTIKSCDNTAQIYCDAQQKGDGRVAYSGGIAGLMGTMAAGVGGLEIGNCTNTARVWNRNYSTTVIPAASTPFGGGIVGAIVGTADSKASIHDCSTSGNDVVELRGYVGGIAGYAGLSALNNNTAAQALTGSNANSQGVGGIVGWASGSSVSGCSFSGAINAVKDIAGLVCLLDGTSSISNCKADGITLTKGTNAAATAPAVLVSKAESGAKIQDCGVKGMVDEVAITLESNMITTDGGSTVSGTYLLD